MSQITKTGNLVLKNKLHYTVKDWNNQLNHLALGVDDQLSKASQFRNESSQLRCHIDNTTKWCQYRNDVKLSDRITENENWIGTLVRTMEYLDRESAGLDKTRTLAEQTLDHLFGPYESAVETLAIRDRRRDFDLVVDDVEIYLKKEVERILQYRDELLEACQAAFEELIELRELRHKLSLELQDKREAVAIDRDQLNKNDSAPEVTFKPDPTRVPKRATSCLKWLEHTKEIVKHAEERIKQVCQMKLDLTNVIQRAQRDIKCDQDSSNFAYRRKIQNTRQALEEMEWKKQQLIDEESSLRKEMRNIEECLETKIQAQKLAESRLEDRCLRPHLELCEDPAQKGLRQECIDIQNNRTTLMNKLEQCRSSVTELINYMGILDKEIKNKKESLDIDVKTLDTRKTINKPLNTDGTK